MKKIIVITIVFMAVFAIISNTYAGMSLPSTGSSVADTAVKTTATKGFEAAINDKIKKLSNAPSAIISPKGLNFTQ